MNKPVNRKELIGHRFGRLQVLQEVVPASYYVRAGNDYPKYRSERYRFLCRCDCGVQKVFFLDNLKTGNTKSCGCLRKEKISAKRRRNWGQTWA